MEYKEADKEQPLYHPLAHVIVNEDTIMINGRKYEILANVKDALDIELLKEKYDPYLDQYDYLVGDISSEHLRLKGFYDEKDRVAIDKKANAIVDYLEEYCNPGSAYFVLYPHSLKPPSVNFMMFPLCTNVTLGKRLYGIYLIIHQLYSTL